jgi:D-glycero-D-manno-heptose 1,7-bisphosphate phosphatase
VGIDAALKRRAAFLDRDGVINRAPVHAGIPHPPASLAELEILPAVPQALERLRGAGYLNIVVTNQPDVARRKTARADVEAIHRELGAVLAIDGFYTCWHDDADRCACRKPLPGLLLSAAHDHAIDLAASVMVGDRWRDVAAGRSAGCRTVWIRLGYDEPEPKDMDWVTASLPEAVEWILRSERTP